MQLTHQVPSILTITGANFAPNSLSIDPGISDAEMNSIWQGLSDIGGAHTWWVGDYGLAADQRYGQGRALAAAAGFGEQTVCRAKGVCQAFQPCRRKQGLSYSHHVEALEGCRGNAELALEWLDKAAENGWSVRDLRAQIRLALADFKELDSGPDKGTAEELALVEFKLLLPSLPAPGRISQSSRQEWIATLAPLVDLYQSLIEAAEPKRVGGRVIAEQFELPV